MQVEILPYTKDPRSAWDVNPVWSELVSLIATGGIELTSEDDVLDGEERFDRWPKLDASSSSNWFEAVKKEELGVCGISFEKDGKLVRSGSSSEEGDENKKDIPIYLRSLASCFPARIKDWRKSPNLHNAESSKQLRALRALRVAFLLKLAQETDSDSDVFSSHRWRLARVTNNKHQAVVDVFGKEAFGKSSSFSGSSSFSSDYASFSSSSGEKENRFSALLKDHSSSEIEAQLLSYDITPYLFDSEQAKENAQNAQKFKQPLYFIFTQDISTFYDSGITNGPLGILHYLMPGIAKVFPQASPKDQDYLLIHPWEYFAEKISGILDPVIHQLIAFGLFWVCIVYGIDCLAKGCFSSCCLKSNKSGSEETKGTWRSRDAIMADIAAIDEATKNNDKNIDEEHENDDEMSKEQQILFRKQQENKIREDNASNTPLRINGVLIMLIGCILFGILSSGVCSLSTERAEAFFHIAVFPTTF